jgi:predicted  nucleic acid-binding Zn-ribbon protein
MGREFTADEIKETAKTARIYCPGFSGEKFESLMELENQLDNSSHLQAVQALLRLEEEKGVPCTEALDACEELFDRATKLEKEAADFELKLDRLVGQIKQENNTYIKLQESIQKAKEDLAEMKIQRQKEEKGMDAFRDKAESEKRRINKELEDCHLKANITQEEVVIAGQVKTEVENRGFTLEVVLDLSKEFSGRENTREKLAEALNRHGSLTKYIDDLAEQGEKQKKELTVDVANLETRKKSLDQDCRFHTNLIQQLHVDVDAEDELRRFYHRYQGVSVLMEYLSGWNQVFFMRCNNPAFTITGAFDRNSGNANFWTDKPPAMCPQCGYRHLLFDERVYQALNCPVGASLKLRLGE